MTDSVTQPSAPPTVPGVGLLPGPLPTEAIEVIASTTTLPDPVEEVGAAAEGNRVLMIGDSILASTSSRYSNDMCKKLVPLGWVVEVEAEVSRGIDFGQKVQRTRLDQGWDAGLIFLGTNHGDDMNDFFARYNDVIVKFGDVPVTVVTTTEFRDSQVRVNEIIRALAGAHPNVTVLDWTSIGNYQGVRGDDGYHLTPTGRKVLADAVGAILGVAPEQPGECLKSLYTDDSAGSVTGGPPATGAGSSGGTRPPSTTPASGTTGGTASTTPGTTGSTTPGATGSTTPGATGSTTGPTTGGTGGTSPPATSPPASNPPTTGPPATSPPATSPPATNPPETSPPIGP